MSEAAGQPSDADVTTLISGDSMIGEVAGMGRLGPGKRLGRYILRDRIGASERGVVYAADDPELDRRVAIKLLRPRDPEALTRDAKRAAALTHPNLVAIHEIGTLHGIVFVVMDHIRGGKSLREWIDEGPHPWHLVVRVLHETGAALAAAHRTQLVHGAFEPEKVLLDAELEPKLTELGLIESTPKRSNADSLAATLTLADQRGSWAYVAPERFDEAAGDSLSDQFAYCVTLYEALYGERPFEGRSIQSVLQAISEGRVRPARAKVPAWLRALVIRGLAHDPAQRWPSMDALLEALDGTPTRRRRRVILAALASLVALAGFAASTCAGRDHEVAAITEPRANPQNPDSRPAQ